jgi:hypothetical protein
LSIRYEGDALFGIAALSNEEEGWFGRDEGCSKQSLQFWSLPHFMIIELVRGVDTTCLMETYIA